MANKETSRRTHLIWVGVAAVCAALITATASVARAEYGAPSASVTLTPSRDVVPVLVRERDSRTRPQDLPWSIGGAMDLCIAVGPDRVLEVSNGGVALSTKDGQLVARTHMWDLFGPAQTVPGLHQSYDPDAIYDPDSGRFFIYAVGQLQNTWKPCDSGCVANEYLAVSRSSSPQSFTTADWYFYELPVTPRRGQRVNYWGDGTTLGVNGKFLGVNMHLYGWGNGQPDVDDRLRMLDKKRLVRGKPARWYDFRDVDNLAADWNEGYSPAQHLSPSRVFFSVQTAGSTIMVLGVWGSKRNPKLRTHTLQGRIGRQAAAGGPPTAPQPGGVPDLQAWSGNTTSIYRDGSIWFTEGVRAFHGGTETTGIRVVEIDVSDWPMPPTLKNEMLLASAGDWDFHPAIAVDSKGNVLVVHASANGSQYASVEYTWSTPANERSLRRSRLLKAGTKPFVGNADDSRFPDVIRFADYFAASFDPVDDTLWVLGQYAGDRRDPTSWVGALRFE